MNQVEDVEVSLGHGRRYKFHSGTLARSSTLFADLLTEGNAARLNSRAKHAGISVRWLVELTRLPDEEFPAGQLSLVVRICIYTYTYIHPCTHPHPSTHPQIHIHPPIHPSIYPTL